MTDLVDYLREKIAKANAGCSCPTPELLAKIPKPGYLLSNCVEHGEVRTWVGAS